MRPSDLPGSSDPQEIKKVGSRELHIAWSDGHLSVYRASYLREKCPCAGCIDEWTGALRIIPGSIPADTGLAKAELVGRYALRFDFSDGHNTGIFSFDYLRALCPCADCTGTAREFAGGDSNG